MEFWVPDSQGTLDVPRNIQHNIPDLHISYSGIVVDEQLVHSTPLFSTNLEEYVNFWALKCIYGFFLPWIKAESTNTPAMIDTMLTRVWEEKLLAAYPARPVPTVPTWTSEDVYHTERTMVTNISRPLWPISHKPNGSGRLRHIFQVPWCSNSGCVRLPKKKLRCSLMQENHRVLQKSGAFWDWQTTTLA